MVARDQKLLLLLFALLLITACRKNRTVGPAPFPPGIEDPIPEQPIAPFVYSVNDVTAPVTNNVAGYVEGLPPDYDTASKYPLLVFLHGGGELGDGATQLEMVRRNGVARLLERENFPNFFTVDGTKYSFIVICPQFRQWPRNPDVRAMIKYARDNYSVDPERIYLSGLSMGGAATWEYAAAYGEDLAAIVPICGASWADSALARNIAASGVPSWAFHNLDDSIVIARSTTRYVSMINAFNPVIAPKMTLWENGGHDAWTKATDPGYKEDDKNMYEWMLQFKR